MMAVRMFKCALIILICLFMTGCDKAGEGLDKQFDRSGQPLEIAVFVYPTRKDMQRAYQERMGGPLDLSRQGWSEWSPDHPEWGCRIHVVEIPGITSNSRMSTWGHELAHCLYGSYHKEL